MCDLGHQTTARAGRAGSITIVLVALVGHLVAAVRWQSHLINAIGPGRVVPIAVGRLRIARLGRGIGRWVPFVQEQTATVVLIMYVLAVLELVPRDLPGIVVCELFD